MEEAEIEAIPVEDWLQDIGAPVGKNVASRWEREGLLKLTIIGGKAFVTREEDARFWTRAKAGEFAQGHVGIVQQQRALNQMMPPVS